MTGWTEWKGQGLPPAFYERDMVKIQYRDGRIVGPESEAWMFAGWNHTGGDTDIVAYQVVN